MRTANWCCSRTGCSSRAITCCRGSRRRSASGRTAVRIRSATTWLPSPSRLPRLRLRVTVCSDAARLLRAPDDGRGVVVELAHVPAQVLRQLDVLAGLPQRLDPQLARVDPVLSQPVDGARYRERPLAGIGLGDD